MKKIISLSVLFAFVLCTLLCSVSALQVDMPFDSRGNNRQEYTPKSCSVTLYASSVNFATLEWGPLTNYSGGNYWEGEIRGTDSANTLASAYGGVSGVSGNLPHLYKEYDSNDLSIGCNNMGYIVSDQYYYAVCSTSAGSSFNSGVNLLFESETGQWLGVDGWPVRCQEHSTHMNTATANRLSWIG